MHFSRDGGDSWLRGDPVDPDVLLPATDQAEPAAVAQEEEQREERAIL